MDLRQSLLEAVYAVTKCVERKRLKLTGGGFHGLISRHTNNPLALLTGS